MTTKFDVGDKVVTKQGRIETIDEILIGKNELSGQIEIFYGLENITNLFKEDELMKVDTFEVGTVVCLKDYGDEGLVVSINSNNEDMIILWEDGQVTIESTDVEISDCIPSRRVNIESVHGKIAEMVQEVIS